MTRLNNKNISKYDYQKVKDLISDLTFDDIREENKIAAAFYLWVNYK